MDATLTTAALSAAEALVQRVLRYDPASRLALSNLEGQVLALQFTQPEWTVYVLPGEAGLCFSSHWEGEVHSRLTGPLKHFIALTRTDQTSLAGSGIQLEGSTHLVQSLQCIIGQLDIDWEEALSEILGDVLGHQSAEFLRSGSRWLKARDTQARRLIGEFITQEAGLVPGRAELDNFYREVDDLALRLERTEARVQHLRTLLNRTVKD